jgi:hypothetical protein
MSAKKSSEDLTIADVQQAMEKSQEVELEKERRKREREERKRERQLKTKREKQEKFVAPVILILTILISYLIYLLS